MNRPKAEVGLIYGVSKLYNDSELSTLTECNTNHVRSVFPN